MSRALVTDLYELNMAVSYRRRAMVGPATFSLFVRSLPPHRSFLVAAGLEDCLAFLESFAFASEDRDWLRQNGFEADDVDALAGLRFTGDVHAVPEGRVVLPDEPILEVTAPIGEAQLVETFLLNQVTFQTAVATKAARCRLAAGDGIELVDFSLRRTHGVDAGMAVARLSAMAGFAATSNVEAARRYGLPAAATMASTHDHRRDHAEHAGLALHVVEHVAVLGNYLGPYGTDTAVWPMQLTRLRMSHPPEAGAPARPRPGSRASAARPG